MPQDYLREITKVGDAATHEGLSNGRHSPSSSSRESLTTVQVLIPMATTGMPPPGHPPTGSGGADWIHHLNYVDFKSVQLPSAHGPSLGSNRHRLHSLAMVADVLVPLKGNITGCTMLFWRQIWLSQSYAFSSVTILRPSVGL